MSMFKPGSLGERRWRSFKSNRRAFYSLWVFLLLFVTCLFAELIANDKPLLASYRGDLYLTAFKFYPETAFGGENLTQAEYQDEVVQCLIVSGGLFDPCLDDPEGVMEQAATGMVDGAEIDKGWMIWAPVRYSFNTVNYDVQPAPGPPDAKHWLGTDDQTRDVLARVIYGFRISTVFALFVVTVSSVIGIAAGASMGYFGGWVDLVFQRVVEIWGNIPSLYIIIILGAILNMSFALLAVLIALFSWTSLVGLVRAEFLRARNFEYTRAARALGVGDWKIMFRHILPNAMVATVTFLPFLVTAAIGSLAALDFLGYGLPASYPSLGELALQAKQNLNAPWLAFAAFTTFAVMLSLLVFVFEGVRDAFDPRKTFK